MARTPKADPQLLFLPLGGTEEIGMNVNCYGFGTPDDADWLVIDLGITFGDDTTPSIDVIVPDVTFLEQNRDRLLGIVLTHGHEDHLGAVPYLWNKLKCPVYASPFTAALLRRKLAYDADAAKVEIIELPMNAKFDIGPFALEFLTLTHSMPEPNAVVLRTPHGVVFHTGDWKFDPDPVVGPTTDMDALRAVGDEGVLALVGDSTNVFVPGTSGSEASLLKNLTDLIADCSGRVAVTCFASNVARLKTIYLAATANGRAVSMVGSSLWRIDSAARETGYLSDVPRFVEPERAHHIPDDEVLYIVTGSQGEPRAALARIAAGEHKMVTLEEGDSVIFSSRIIPGNELAIGRIHNRLVQRGVRVVTTDDDEVHVSGHPAQDELVRMYQLIRPRISVPVHGEPRHLAKHLEIARDCQVPEGLLMHNGAMARLAPGTPMIVDEVPVGRLAVDGHRLVPLRGQVLKERSKMLQGGSAVVTLVLDKNGKMLDDPQVTFHGLIDDDEAVSVSEKLGDDIEDALEDMSHADLRDDEKVAEAARRAVRRSLRDSHGKQPIASIHVVRV
jgi:ribonuclease J